MMSTLHNQLIAGGTGVSPVRPHLLRSQFDRVTGAAAQRSRRGFTLIEMMLVIAILGVLVGLTLLVGRAVFAEGKVRQTDQILQVLDSLVTEYQAEYQSIPKYEEDDYLDDELGEFMTDMNGTNVQLGDIRPEVAVFIERGRGLAGFDSMLASIPPDFLMHRYIRPSNSDPDYEGKPSLYQQAAEDGLTRYAGLPDDEDFRLTVRDAWGMEILYVHPDHDAATIGEASEDSDFKGYGRTKNRRPYFVSAGPDLIYYGFDDLGDGTQLVGMDDNIYSYEPER